jgi:hypothetical protein
VTGINYRSSAAIRTAARLSGNFGMPYAFRAPSLQTQRTGTFAMRPARTLILLAAAVALSACASGGTTRPTGAAELVNLTLQPARISPNPQGAMLLSEVTGCFVEFVGRGSAESVFQFRVAPTARMPSLEQCLTSLRSQPGVTGVQLAK